MRSEDYGIKVAKATILARQGHLDEALALLNPEDKARQNTMRGLAKLRMENPPPMTHAETTTALEPTDSVAGDSASEGIEVADPDPDASQGDSAPSLPSKWCYNCNQYSTFVDECDTCHGDVADPPDLTEIIVSDTCQCGKPTDLFSKRDREAFCLPCFFDKKMTLPCFQCQRHVTEILVRAVATDGTKDFVGVCLRCLEKHVSSQNN